MLLGIQKTPDYKTHREAIYNNYRFHHTYVIGKSGTGKSTALVRWALEDIHNGDGVLFLDPHGSSVEDIYNALNPHQQRQIVYFDVHNPQPFNILRIEADNIATNVADILRNHWKESWGAYPELFIQMAVHVLKCSDRSHLFDIKRLLTNQKYRDKLLQNVTDPAVLEFWQEDFANFSKRDKQERPLSTINKLMPILTDHKMQQILGKARSRFVPLDVIRKQRVLLCNLNEGCVGANNSRLLSNLILSAFHVREEVPPFHIYIDEAHHIAPFLAEMLSGIRKFGVSLTLANQYLDQFTPEMRSAVLGTVGTLVAFRTGVDDGKLLSQELGDNPAFLPPFQTMVRTPDETYQLEMPDGAVSSLPS